ncbi:sigma 54-interacting response regulator [Mucilaginibacter aquaedulcis]|uniref:sigma 54-interacting response regulator n=1 Tax=Mucilaginibacter aquaedulcis TaxID=1187081 RepID=UPI0025B508D6|nr:sigma 54-interacting response regulator [Mucilaginibacter aquaedulcis]MDN3548864.1 sigma 54-interacting response regulator [Mucilaginibacter aquaedulcis]
MGDNILIVEDEFIEANDLRSVLEQAGYRVCGIARSVSQANELIMAYQPDIVLVDIFLKGKQTGIDLAKKLTAKNMPFIYLSANSNPSTLAEAKATQPYGFLVKPFREKDILIALEIAAYRFKHAREVLTRHEEWLQGLLSNIQAKENNAFEKLLSLASAFQPFLHFDFVLIDTDIMGHDIHTLTGFQRINYDSYKALDIFASGDIFLLLKDLAEVRKSILNNSEICYRNKQDFFESMASNKVNRQVYALLEMESELAVPVLSGDVSASFFFYSRQPECFNDEQVKLMRAMLPALAETIRNIKNTQNRVGRNDSEQAVSVREKTSFFPGIIGNSPQLLSALDQVTQVAPFETSVLLLGETGTGKEGLVNLIHQLSPRSRKPLIKINCASIPESLVESEFFGHEKGAFTGANERRIGKFEQAAGGTVFLDEIGEISLDMQSKLLRVLQEKEIERVGGRQTVSTDVRIIAATNRNLEDEVAKGAFRMDLYYRINVFPIMLAPLRQRKEDIPLLVNYFLSERARISGQKTKNITQRALEQLMDYSWPGNIRQLQHLIERMVIITDGREIDRIELPSSIAVNEAPDTVKRKVQSIGELERNHIMEVLQNCMGKISGSGGAAEILQLPVATLRMKMKKLGIQWHHTFGQ